MELLRSFEIISVFDLSEMELLSYRLKVDFEDLPGSSKFKKALSLQEHMKKHGRLLDLFQELQKQLPNRAADLPGCLHELIAQQGNTEAKLTTLFTALGLEVRNFGGPETEPWGSPSWRESKAEKLQLYMWENGRWPQLLQTLADQSGGQITRDQLDLLFGAEKPAPPPVKLPATAVFKPFLTLNYRAQVTTFRHNLDRPVAAFAVSSQPAYGAHLLLKRLLIDMGPETAVTPLSLATNSLPNNPDALWRQIAHKVGLGQARFQFPLSAEDKATIINGVCNQLQTRHVIFFLEGITDQLLPLLIEQFWETLAPQVVAWQAKEGQNSDRKLLAFLVDERGKLSEDVLAVLPPADPPPIPLPPLKPFTREHLEAWLVDLIPHECDPPFRQFAFRPETTDEVLQSSNNGIPEQVLEYICGACGYDYYGEFSSWLKP
ncbi:MAG: hypothetical protein H6659_02845 [Ardenticatenaceae bacterium]|nr:hypothetical protein [Ardenticatenaceae bacterium]MCB8986823.1 hypothetical protein [Ardenticatenaceae bacterium]